MLNLQCAPAQGAQYNSGADQRIIKMQDMPVDPLEPPKFRHKKVRLAPPRLPATDCMLVVGRLIQDAVLCLLAMPDTAKSVP